MANVPDNGDLFSEAKSQVGAGIPRPIGNVIPTLVLDNSVPASVCAEVIQLYYDNESLCHAFGDPLHYPLDLSRLHDKSLVTDLVLKPTMDIAAPLFGALSVDWVQIVRRPGGTWHNWHIDTASNKTVATSITFLNEDFRGGELRLYDGTQIAPVIGRTIFLDGLAHLHSVMPSFGNDRFVVASWYCRKDKDDG
jgi:hypothetical protein